MAPSRARVVFGSDTDAISSANGSHFPPIHPKGPVTSCVWENAGTILAALIPSLGLCAVGVCTIYLLCRPPNLTPARVDTVARDMEDIHATSDEDQSGPVFYKTAVDWKSVEVSTEMIIFLSIVAVLATVFSISYLVIMECALRRRSLIPDSGDQPEIDLAHSPDQTSLVSSESLSGNADESPSVGRRSLGANRRQAQQDTASSAEERVSLYSANPGTAALGATGGTVWETEM